MTTRPRSRLIALCTLLTGLLALSACGSDGDGNNPGGPGGGSGGSAATLTSAWAGEWQTTFTNRDCTTGEIIDSGTETDLLCAGETLSFEDDVFCSGTVTDNSFSVSCDETFTANGCTITISVTLNGTRTGESYTITGQVVGTASGAGCKDGENFCTEIMVTGTRISTSQTGCDGTFRVSKYLSAF